MKNINRGYLIAGIGLVFLGVLFIIFNLFSKITGAQTWPIILLVAAFGFFLPALVWPQSKKELASLYIPGAILFVLGAIFLFNTLTDQWGNVWLFAWLLIPGSVGLGLMLASWIGQWSHSVWTVGAWIAAISLVLFAVLAGLFGKSLPIKYTGAGCLLVLGLIFLIRSFLNKKAAV